MIKHRHALFNHELWQWGNGIFSYIDDETPILTIKGLKKNKDISGWIMFIICKKCRKGFYASYDDLRYATMKKTGEYLPA